MKQGHFAILFCIIFAICFLFLWKERKYYEGILQEKQWIENGLLEAIESTAKEFSDVIYDSEEKKKKVVETVFLETLYVALGIFDEKAEQEKMQMYLPLIVLIEEDGALFYHMQEVCRNGTMELQHSWTEKMDLSFLKESTEEKKKQLLSELLEEKVAELFAKHNYIAKQYGIEYVFSAPDFIQNTAETLELPMLLVVFQGWPLTSTGDVVYENCIDASAFLQETERYVVEVPKKLTNTICFYHKKNCSKLNEKEGSMNEEWLTEEEAIRKYGAFPCEICNGL